MKLRDLLSVIYDAQLVQIRVYNKDYLLWGGLPEYPDCMTCREMCSECGVKTVDSIVVKCVLQVGEVIKIECEVERG